MDTRAQHTSLAALSSPLHSLAFPRHWQEPVGEEFPDLAPGLMMSTLRAARLWGGMAWRRAFPGRGDQSAVARRMVGQLLADTGRVEDAVWVTAELVSNALRHTCSGRERGFFVVEVLRGAASVRIVVYDLGGGPAPDFSRTPGRLPEAEEGRGLAGVAKLASRTGAAGDEVTGHAVWAELALAGQATGPVSEGTTPAVTAERGWDVPEPGGVRELSAADRPDASRQQEGVRLDPSAALWEAS
ncbi:ATP-binding protein [Nonomuraea sp. NPDC059007]|uniref:ATP-binding protein n=1 Tax=Nonomuraea sp. NPDC059007 TaxID=3346692 RepID=UPI0036B277AC